MTAIESATLKVSVPETPLPYVLPYRDVVGKSIWNPHASEGLSLVSRVVVLTAALLVGYFLIKALFSIYSGYTASIDRICGQKNLNDRCSAAHTHRESTDPLPKEEILKLCDRKNLEEGVCLYTGEGLEAAKAKIRLLMEDYKTWRLKNYILLEFLDERNGFSKKKQYALGALFVLLGIKPALAIEEGLDKELSDILNDLTLTHKHLRLKKPHCFSRSKTEYFVNETPFPSFDPRHFLNLHPEVSLTDAVVLCFANNKGSHAIQFLSYLLGYGPSWEAFSINTDYLYQEQHSVSCMFNGNHYYEIGNVLNQALSKGCKERSEIEKLGFTFHAQFASLIGRGHWLKKQRSEEKGTFTEKEEIAVATILAHTGAAQMFDGLTARTDYFKKSYTLKKWVLEEYFPDLLQSAILFPIF